jgi:hypothetical protein
LACPRCGAECIVKKGRPPRKQKKVQEFRCTACGRRFNDSVINTRMSSRTLERLLDLVIDESQFTKIVYKLNKWGYKVNAPAIPGTINRVVELLQDFEKSIKRPKVGETWFIDENQQKISRTEKSWFINILEEEPRYWTMAVVSPKWDKEASIEIFKRALERTKVIPLMVKCDGHSAYANAAKEIFPCSETDSRKKKRKIFVWNCVPNDEKESNRLRDFLIYHRFLFAKYAKIVKEGEKLSITLESNSIQIFCQGEGRVTIKLNGTDLDDKIKLIARRSGSRLVIYDAIDFSFINTIESPHGNVVRITIPKTRRFRSIQTAQNILELTRFHYNFLRPHSTLNGMTPAQASGIPHKFSSWMELLRYARYVVNWSRYRKPRQ